MIQKTSTFSASSILSGIALTVTITLTGCNATDTTADASDTSVPEPIAETTNTENDEQPIAATPVAPPEETGDSAETVAQDVIVPDTIVSETGLGTAQLGMTLDELKQALPDLEFTSQSPFMVDFDAIAVNHQEETLFYILHLAGSPLAGDDRIQALLTDHSMFKTAEDVGVGTPVHAAEVPYGKAVLSYNTGNESREYVRFEEHPATNISFGTQANAVDQNDQSSGLAGIYETPSNQYNETDRYKDNAAIEAILVVCLSATCSQ